MAKKGIRQSGKRILKITLLLTLKELWFLFKNGLGLIYHPFLTLRKIKEERDFSQTFLIISLISAPLGISSLLTAILFLASRIFGFYLPYEKEFLLFLIISSGLFLLLSIFYLAYWSAKVVKKNRFNFYSRK